MTNHLGRIRQLGSDGHELDLPLGGLPEAVEERDGRSQQQLRRMHSALLMREEWSLQMNANRNRIVQGGRLSRAEQFSPDH